MVFAMIATLLVALLIATGRWSEVGGPTTMAVRTTIASLGSCILVALVVCHAGHPVLALLRTAPLVYLGTISYGLYLYHHPIIFMSDILGSYLRLTPGPALGAIECVLSLVLAVASWHLIERPILRLKDRMPYLRNDVTPENEGSSSPAFMPDEVLSPSAA